MIRYTLGIIAFALAFIWAFSSEAHHEPKHKVLVLNEVNSYQGIFCQVREDGDKILTLMETKTDESWSVEYAKQENTCNQTRGGIPIVPMELLRTIVRKSGDGKLNYVRVKTPYGELFMFTDHDLLTRVNLEKMKGRQT